MRRLLAMSAVLLCTIAAMPQNPRKGTYGYLYCHMSDRGQWTAYALSRDGYHYEDVMGGEFPL